MVDPLLEVHHIQEVPWQQVGEGNLPLALQNILQLLRKIIPWEWEFAIHFLQGNSQCNDQGDFQLPVDHSSVLQPLPVLLIDHLYLQELPPHVEPDLMLVNQEKCHPMPGYVPMIGNLLLGQSE